VEAEDIEISLPQVDVGKPDKAEAFLPGPRRLSTAG
jgi:hypothetical protein